MKYAIGQKVWVEFAQYEPLGWFPGVVVGYSTARPGKYLCEVNGRSFVEVTNPAPDSEGCWRIFEEHLRPREDDPPKHELGEWELCPWRPSSETVSEKS